MPPQPLDGLVQVLDLLAEIKVFSGQSRDLVLQASLRVVGRALVDRVVDDLLLFVAGLAQLLEVALAQKGKEN